MDHPQTIEVLVRRVAREVRVRRAEHWGLRGAFWGALVAAAVLVFKAALGLAALAVAPVLVALGAIGDFTPSTEPEQREERTTTELMEERSRPLQTTPLKRPSVEERDFAQKSGTGSGSTAGDLSAIFKDTALSSQRPDFNSFLK